MTTTTNAFIANVCAASDEMVAYTPPAEQKAPGAQVTALTWCAAALQAAIPFEDMESSIRLLDTGESKTLNEILDLANAALASQTTAPALSEPVGWLYPTSAFFVRGAERPDERASWRPLYDHAAPNQTPAPAAQGLTDAEIEAEVQRSFSRGTSHWLFAMGVRFAEQRHGIIAASRTTPKDGA